MKQKENRTSTIVFIRLCVLFYFVFLIGHAQQENINRRTLQTGADRIDLQFSEIGKISIESSDKDFIEVVAVNQFGGLAGFNLDETSDVVRITGVPTPKPEMQEFKSCGIQPDFCDYEVKIPEGKKVFMQVQEGNIDVHNFDGILQLTLEKGFVGLKNSSGRLQIEVQAGNVYSHLNNVKFELESRLGNIFVNGHVVSKENEMSSYSGLSGMPVSQLRIKANHANIYVKEVK